MKNQRSSRKSVWKITLSVLWTAILLTVIVLGTALGTADVQAGTINPSSRGQNTIGTVILTVNIPDANLNTALHTKCGVPASESLTYANLAALTGTLDLDNKSIANLEGVQYCVNVSRLLAGGNPLSSLPNLSGMTVLEYLSLSSCQFSDVPATISTIPSLTSLNMSNNALTAINGVVGSPQLISVVFRDNKLATLPDSLNLPSLTSIDLAANQFTTFPIGVTGLPNLIELAIGGNEIETLPAEIGSMPKLKVLVAADNRIRAIPDSFGSSKIAMLYLNQNRIKTLPDSLFASSFLNYLDIGINRLTSVPQSIKAIDFQFLDLEFNYMNVAAGSANLAVIDGITAVEKTYLRQLTPITDLASAVTGNTIQISWTASPDSEDGTYTAKVNSYVVYLNESEVLTELATLDKNTTTFTETGLTLGQQRRYTVAVVYDLVAPFVSATTKYYSSISATTSGAAATETTAPTTVSESTTAPSSLSASDSSSLAAGETAEGSDENAAGNENAPGIPTWLFIVIVVIAVGGIAATSVLYLKMKAKNKVTFDDDNEPDDWQ